MHSSGVLHPGLTSASAPREKLELLDLLTFRQAGCALFALMFLGCLVKISVGNLFLRTLLCTVLPLQNSFFFFLFSNMSYLSSSSQLSSSDANIMMP